MNSTWYSNLTAVLDCEPAPETDAEREAVIKWKEAAHREADLQAELERVKLETERKNIRETWEVC